MKLAPQEERTFFVSATASGGRRLLQSQQAAHLFIETIQRNRELKRMLVHEYVVMPTHLHLILTPAEDCSLEDCMRYLKGGYSFEAGKRFGNKGIWQPGYNEQRIKTAEEYDSIRE